MSDAVMDMRTYEKRFLLEGCELERSQEQQTLTHAASFQIFFCYALSFPMDTLPSVADMKLSPCFHPPIPLS